MGGSSSKSSRQQDKLPQSNAEAEELHMDVYLEAVKDKLKLAYPDMGDNERSELSEGLRHKDRLKKQYFEPLRAQGASAVKVSIEEAETFSRGGYPNEGTKCASHSRIVVGAERVRKLEVHLLLFELHDEHLKRELAHFFNKYVRRFTFGPYHAALKIGSIILEWDETSLIIPHAASDYTTEASGRILLFEGNVHDSDSQSESRIQPIPVRAGAETTLEGFTMQINHILDITEEKDTLLDELADVVVMYNTKFQYGLFGCNCHHFAVDVLQALGKDDEAKYFQGKINELASVLKRRGNVTVAEFNTHEELNNYVHENVANMSLEDLEFCHCNYLLFHAWSKKSPNRIAWKCDSNTCLSARVAQKVT